MKIPTLSQAKIILVEAETLNPGPWVSHSMYVAQGASIIAGYHPHLDPETAAVLGILHDIGRRAGKTAMRHILDGYYFMQEQEYADAARICLTHSFPVMKRESAAGRWDCTAEELAFIDRFLAEIELDEYDYLIQLCDTLALPSGFTIIEKRQVDVVLRHGLNDYTLARWQAYFHLKDRFEAAIGRSIYKLLPGIVENTLGFNK